MTTREKILKSLEILGYATLPHLEKFFPESKDPFKMLNAQLVRLEKAGEIKKRVLGDRKKDLYRTIYFINDPEKFKANDWYHEFALKDAESSILNYYGFNKGYDVFITNNVRVERIHKKHTAREEDYYRPDGLVIITTPNHSYSFYLEMQRSLTGNNLINKIKESLDTKYLYPEKMRVAKRQFLFPEPLDANTKYLYIITANSLDVFERPPFSSERMAVENKLTENAMKYQDPAVLYAPLHFILTNPEYAFHPTDIQ